MIKHNLMAIVIVAGCSGLLSAQSGQTMRANIRGGGGDEGKCTIEVNVDGVADVEIRGDMGRIHTLQGQPSHWRRFECNSVMPRNPVDFRFKGIDGRGNVQLIRDPNNSAGAAVIRIEDPKGGTEGYTFDLEWRGGSGTYSSNRYDPYGPNRSRRNNDPYYDERYSPNRAYDYRMTDEVVSQCQDAVRVQARREQGIRDPYFTSTNIDDLRGNRDRVVGTFEGRRGELYDYSCIVNTNNGNIRTVDIRRR